MTAVQYLYFTCDYQLFQMMAVTSDQLPRNKTYSCNQEMKQNLRPFYKTYRGFMKRGITAKCVL